MDFHINSLRSARDLLDSGVVGRTTLAPAGVYERPAPFCSDLEDANPTTATHVQLFSTVVLQEYLPTQMITLGDARLGGQGAVVSRHAELLQESVLEFIAHGLVPDGMAAAPGGFAFTQDVSRYIDRPCLLAKRPWYRNYGHWLVDSAALLGLAAEQCRAQNLAVVVGDCESAGMRRVMQDTMARILPGVEVLYHPDGEVWSFAQLSYVTPVHIPPLFKLPASLAKVSEAMLGGPPSGGSRRLFVSRGAAAPASRALLNEDDILGMCVREGFELVYPERLPIVEQARMFAEAAIVIGVKGAALANIMFSAPGSAVVVLSPADFPDPFFWDIAGQRGLHYGEIFGAITGSVSQGQNSFSIKKEKVQAVLKRIEQLS